MTERLKNTMTIEWVSVDLATIIQHYVKGFKIPEGKELCNYEAFIDVGKRKVAFQLSLNTKSTP